MWDTSSIASSSTSGSEDEPHPAIGEIEEGFIVVYYSSLIVRFQLYIRKMSTFTSEQVFSLSAVAAEIRQKFPQKYQTIHDDYMCLRDFTDEASFNVTVGGVDFGSMGDVGSITKALYERLFESRKKLIEQYTKEAELQHTELKKRAAELAKTEPELEKMKDIPSSEASTAMDLIKSVDILRSGINGYYKVKVEESGGKAFFERLGEIVFIAVKNLSTGVPIPEDIFVEGTDFLQEPLLKVSSLFTTVKPHVRAELIGRFNLLLKALLACFTLYRFPVLIARGQKPVYLSRFASAIKFKPFLDLYGMEMGTFTLIP